VWRLAALSLALIGALALPASAAGQEPSRAVVAAPEFVKQFPALVPVGSTAQSSAEAQASGALGPDGRALVAAIYWIFLGALALRQVRRRPPREDSTPVAAWVLGHAPPLPR
jgi:hypothetical protein